MRMNLAYSGLLLGAIVLSWQTNCSAQAAFFPILRTDTAYNAAHVEVELNSFAGDTDDSIMGVWGTYIDVDSNDENLAGLAENSAALQGNAVASSTANPTAEIIPNTSTWAMVAECSVSIGGIYSCHEGTETCSAWVQNDQLAWSEGEFEVLPNPTYPLVTGGTMLAQFHMVVSVFPWEYGSAYAYCDESWVMVTYSGGEWDVIGYLAGYGEYSDSGSGDFSFLLTAESPAPGTFFMGSGISGSNGGLINDSDTPSVSLVASCFVTSP